MIGASDASVSVLLAPKATVIGCWVIPRQLIGVGSKISPYDLPMGFCMKKSRFTDSQILAILKEAECHHYSGL